jgi:hypothetical protein
VGAQVQQAISQKAQYVTILIGANDVCTSSISTTTRRSGERLPAVRQLQVG